jgi:hypothetical protein
MDYTYEGYIHILWVVMACSLLRFILGVAGWMEID